MALQWFRVDVAYLIRKAWRFQTTDDIHGLQLGDYSTGCFSVSPCVVVTAAVVCRSRTKSEPTGTKREPKEGSVRSGQVREGKG